MNNKRELFLKLIGILSIIISGLNCITGSILSFKLIEAGILPYLIILSISGLAVYISIEFIKLSKKNSMIINKNRKSLHIMLIVVLAIFSICSYLGLIFSYYYYYLNIISSANIVLIYFTFPLNIILMIKGNDNKIDERISSKCEDNNLISNNNQIKIDFYDEKIKKIKQLKEENIISEEQYDEIIKKILEKNFLN